MKYFISVVSTLFFVFSVFAQNQAEVIVTSTYLRKSPEVSSKKIQTIQRGEKVTLEKSQNRNGWYFVSILNGTVKGWIRKDTVNTAKAEAGNQSARTAVSNSPAPVPIGDSIVITVPKPKIAKPRSTVSAKTPSPAPPDVAVAAQPVDDEVIRVDAEEISLNVRVVNDSNRPVNNLNETDFKVYEDNVLQPITYFTTSEIPIVNALLIDNSRSLRDQLAEVIVAGKIIVSANRSKDESAIVRFVSKDKIEVVQDFTANKNSLNEALNNLFVEGGQTAIIDAVYQTAKKVEQYQNSAKKEDVKLRSLIIVSDGDDRGSSYKERELFELLRQLNIQIYAVGFVEDLSKEPESAGGISRRDKARTFLTRLAEETGGRVYFPNSISELPQIAAEISSELRTQYLISYNPTNTTRNGAFREIKVVVNESAKREKRTAITRTGRNSPTN